MVGEGGFGLVYRAHDPELQRPVAVKIPRCRWEVGQKTNLLLDEARKLAKLRCPGIVAVHDVGQEEGLTFVVSNFIAGANLAALIASHRPAPLDAARLVAEIAENLHFAHEQGFTHRDIKPANILIDEHSKPLITDFGIAATAVEAVCMRCLAKHPADRFRDAGELATAQLFTFGEAAFGTRKEMPNYVADLGLSNRSQPGGVFLEK